MRTGDKKYDFYIFIYRNKNKIMICQICQKEYKTQQALNSHVGFHNNPNRVSSFIEYNKKNIKVEKKYKNQFDKAKKLGLPKPIVSDETKQKIGYKSTINNNNYWKNPMNRIKQSNSMKKAVLENPDSYSSENISGRVKSYESVDSFNNKTKLKGKWELKVANFLTKKNIRWTNKVEPSSYFWSNNWHLYFPDFYLPDKNIYLEIKGFQRDRDEQKWKYFKEKLIILKRKEISDLENWYVGPAGIEPATTKL